jgi:hypothetical protein
LVRTTAGVPDGRPGRTTVHGTTMESREWYLTAAELAADAREICLTLHGPGFGLDETEAFESEVAGLLDAITSNEVSPELGTITFVEWDSGRAERMGRALATLLPARRVERAQPLGRGSMP